jgi:hypothetical protein
MSCSTGGLLTRSVNEPVVVSAPPLSVPPSSFSVTSTVAVPEVPALEGDGALAKVAVPVVEVEGRARIQRGRRDAREEWKMWRSRCDRPQAGAKVGFDGAHQVAVVRDSEGKAPDEEFLARDFRNDCFDGHGLARNGDRGWPVDRRNVDETWILRNELAPPSARSRRARPSPLAVGKCLAGAAPEHDARRLLEGEGARHDRRRELSAAVAKHGRGSDASSASQPAPWPLKIRPTFFNRWIVQG